MGDSSNHFKETSEIARLVDIDGNFVFSNNVVFVATYQGDIAAIDTRSGRTFGERRHQQLMIFYTQEEKYFLLMKVITQLLILKILEI